VMLFPAATLQLTPAWVPAHPVRLGEEMGVA
jgi:hypothetical protein